MRQLFFVWRNLLWSVDYVGFEHYRRLLLLDPLPASECAERYPRVLRVRAELTANAMKWRGDVDADTFVEYLRLRNELAPTRRDALREWVAGFDVICARRYFQHPVDVQWRLCALPDNVWHAFVDAITRSSYMAVRRNHIDYHQIGAHFCNMFICKANLFEEYMSFWAEIMAALREAVDTSTRHLGYLSERLFSLWMLQKQIENPLLRVTELPVLYCEDIAGVSQRFAALRSGHY